MPILSQRGYAQHRGVSRRAVQKAIEARRISVESNGRIDSEKADREWAQNTRPHAQPVSSEADGHYQQVRAMREWYEARLAKMEYEERTGQLIPKDEVQAKAFNQYRRFRENLLNIPDRLAALVAAETDIGKIRDMVDAEIRRAIQEFPGDL